MRPRSALRRMPKPATVAEYVAQVDPEMRPLFRAVRAFVRKSAPSLDEGLYMGMPNFKGRAWMLYLADHSRHVNLGFYHGARLADPDGLLEGTGKSLRHVKVRSKADLTPELARLIRSAVAHDRGTR